jgi:anti-sigma B factor antagonist
VEHLDGHVEYFLAGDLEVGNAEALRERITALSEQTEGGVILDLGELEFLDSTGIRALLLAQRDLAAGGGELVLRNAQGPVQRVLELTGLTSHLHAE